MPFCYICTVSPLDGSASINFEKDLITVSQTALDCSTALTDAGFVLTPDTFPYSSVGTGVTIVPGFSSIFTHSQTTDCPVTSCILKDSGCGGTKKVDGQTDVTIEGSPPFAVTAIETNLLGYVFTFCYECTVSPFGGGTLIQFPKDLITVTQNPLDCSIALTHVGFTDPAAISFNSAGTGVTVASGFSDIFTHSQPTDCPVTSCVLRD